MADKKPQPRQGLFERIKDAFRPIINATYSYNGGGSYRTIMTSGYNGEKNYGEAGPIRDYWLDYDALRARSWQAFLESEIAKTVLNKFNIWVVDKGLKLQTAPVREVLLDEGVDLDTELFNEKTERRWEVWSKNKFSAWSNMSSLNTLAQQAHLNAIVGGDVLVVLRVVDNYPTVELIDGAHLYSPMYGNDRNANVLGNGNYIRNGIEMDARGKHIAYYVQTYLDGVNDLKTERIPAKNAASGLTQAYLVYGNKHRLDNHRGIPLIATVIETMKKMERYKEATLGTAEEQAKIAYQITHDMHSTGENPIQSHITKAFDVQGNIDFPTDINGTQLADRVAATTNKQAINMPIGSKVMPLAENKRELYFKDFYDKNIDIVCACVGIPPNVAMSIYNDSFSASRAATKDWEHTLIVERDKFSTQFYQPIYEMFLHIEVLKSKIPAPMYLKLYYENNLIGLGAYRNARFTGPLFPHIDPVKEVNAERLKLGELAANIPLTTVEAATEFLNSGDSDSNMEQFSKELQYARQLKLEVVPPTTAPPSAEQQPTNN